MKQSLLIGSKIRRLRKQAKLSQVALAKQLEVSPSYLNLIEHNQRALTRPLLLKLGQVLQIEPHVLSGGEEGRLLSNLTEIFADPLFKGETLGTDALTRLVGAAPEVAASISSLYQAYRKARSDAMNLSEHLADNPFLEATSHRLLTLLTSIRSFSEILRDNADLSADRRRQYIGTVASESEKMTDLVNVLFGFFSADSIGRQQRGESPMVAVDEYLEANGNYFSELEDVAQAVRRDLPWGDSHLGGAGLGSGLADRLSKNHGITIEILAGSGAGPALQSGSGADASEGKATVIFDESSKCLRLSEILPQSSRTFAIAHRVALAAASPEIDAMAARAEFGSPAAEDLLRTALGKYLAAAIIMPYGEFQSAARDLRNDIDILRRRFAVSFEQACHRLTTLQRPGAEGVPFHFLRVDIAGNIAKRLGVSGLRVPRFGGICPRWNAHRAFTNPGQIDTQLARFPDGGTFIFLARAQSRQVYGHRAPRRHYAVTIGCDASFARNLVYADSFGAPSENMIAPVGLNCPQCTRRDCTDRAFPTFLD